MLVIPACPADIPAWNDLAHEVELLFGAPMANAPAFLEILQRKIMTRLAFCIREMDGPLGTPLCGGLFFSTHRSPVYQIGWLAVAGKWQRCGIGRALVEYVFSLVVPPAEIIVTSFHGETPGGEPARRFYVSLGFIPAELLPGEGPNGETRQRFRKIVTRDPLPGFPQK